MPVFFFIWGSVQKQVNELQPSARVELQVATDKCVSATPQSAIDGFYKRRKLCVAQGGRTFKHVLKSKVARDARYPLRGGLPIGGAEADVVDVPANDDNDGYLEET